jgi:hypothetical protein
MATFLNQSEIVVKRLPKARGVAAQIEPRRAEAAKYRAKEKKIVYF